MGTYIAGIDIGNATTETALGEIEKGTLLRCTSGISKTTGIKGTKENIYGMLNSLKEACGQMGISAVSYTHLSPRTDTNRMPRYGVWNLGCSLENPFGITLSRLIP